MVTRRGVRTSVVRRSIVVQSTGRVKLRNTRLWYVESRRALRHSRPLDVVPAAVRHLQHFRPRQGIRADHARDPLLRGRGAAGAAPQRAKPRLRRARARAHQADPARQAARVVARPRSASCSTSTTRRRQRAPATGQVPRGARRPARDAQAAAEDIASCSRRSTRWSASAASGCARRARARRSQAATEDRCGRLD